MTTKKQISRRALLAHGSLTTLVAGSLSPPASAAASKPRRRADGWTQLRRVVTSNNADGKSSVLFDDEPTNVTVLNGTRLTRLWETPGVPVALPLREDAGATAGNAYRAGFRGTSFYVAELPGGSRAPDIPMHKNATVDFMAILSGRIVLRTEEKDVELGPGDTIVQGGNLHTWINKWREPCLLLFVVLTGEPVHHPIP